VSVEFENVYSEAFVVKRERLRSLIIGCVRRVNGPDCRTAGSFMYILADKQIFRLDHDMCVCVVGRSIRSSNVPSYKSYSSFCVLKMKDGVWKGRREVLGSALSSKVSGICGPSGRIAE